MLPIVGDIVKWTLDWSCILVLRPGPSYCENTHTACQITIFWITTPCRDAALCRNSEDRLLYKWSPAEKERVREHTTAANVLMCAGRRRIKLHNIGVLQSYVRPILFGWIRWAGHAVHMGKTRRPCGIWIRISEGNKPVLRPWRGDFIEKILKCRLLWIRVMLLRERGGGDYVESTHCFRLHTSNSKTELENKPFVFSSSLRLVPTTVRRTSFKLFQSMRLHGAPPPFGRGGGREKSCRY